MKKQGPTRTQLTRRATAAARRAAVLEDGGKALYVLLDKEHADMLARIMAHNQASATDVICTLLAVADGKVPRNPRK